jgi:bis(5'-adenosyl)-triphosphatase
MHVHLIPRKKLDFSQNDEVYDHIERSGREMASTLLTHAFPKIEDDRMARTETDMASEAAWLATFFK